MNKALILTLSILPLIGCDDKAPEASNVIGGQGPYINLKTATHDGHKLIIATTNSTSGGATMLHHPDCDCFASKK